MIWGYLNKTKKQTKNLLWVFLFENISLDIHLTVYQEHFVHN